MSPDCELFVQQSYLTTRGSNLLAVTAWLMTRLSQLEASMQPEDYLPTIRYLKYGTAREAYGCNLWHPSLYGLHLLLIKHMEAPRTWVKMWQGTNKETN